MKIVTLRKLFGFRKLLFDPPNYMFSSKNYILVNFFVNFIILTKIDHIDVFFCYDNCFSLVLKTVENSCFIKIGLVFGNNFEIILSGDISHYYSGLIILNWSFSTKNGSNSDSKWSKQTVNRYFKQENWL